MILTICAIVGGVCLAVGAGIKIYYEASECRDRRELATMAANCGGDDDFYVVYRPPEKQSAAIVFEYA